jgi:hypothetical protein
MCPETRSTIIAAATTAAAITLLFWVGPAKASIVEVFYDPRHGLPMNNGR